MATLTVRASLKNGKQTRKSEFDDIFADYEENRLISDWKDDEVYDDYNGLEIDLLAQYADQIADVRLSDQWD